MKYIRCCSSKLYYPCLIVYDLDANGCAVTSTCFFKLEIKIVIQN